MPYKFFWKINIPGESLRNINFNHKQHPPILTNFNSFHIKHKKYSSIFTNDNTWHINRTLTFNHQLQERRLCFIKILQTSNYHINVKPIHLYHQLISISMSKKNTYRSCMDAFRNPIRTWITNYALIPFSSRPEPTNTVHGWKGELKF